MRCDHVDDVLNTHAYSDLAPGARAEIDSHLSGCARCARAWRVGEILAVLPVAAADSALFDRIVARLDEGAEAPRTSAVPRWLPPVGLAALFAFVALAVVLIERPADPSVDGGNPSSYSLSDGPSAAGGAAARFVEGRHFRRLPAAARSAPGGAEVEVVEMFMYACFPCFAFEPHLRAWSESHAEEIHLERVPVTWGPLAALHARAFYTAEILGESERIHAAFFREVHELGNPLGTRAALAEFFERQGVDRAIFARVFESSAVDERIARADALARRFGIEGTPSLVVDGAFLTGGGMAASYEMLVEIVDGLVTEAASCRGRGAPASCRL